MAQQKYYVVWRGKATGVFLSWDECKSQIEGFQNARYKSFTDYAEARAAYEMGADNFTKAECKKLGSDEIILPSISVDAACGGNPGIMEYQCVETASKHQIFYKKFPLGTNNIGEFLAIVHALSYLKKHHKNVPIYTDSVTAIKWVKDKKAKTKLERTPETEELFDFLERAEQWLHENTYSHISILKWDTENWGEIPADFGRK